MSAERRTAAPKALAPQEPRRGSFGARGDGAQRQGGQTTGLVLFAHGARDPAWAAPFEAVATRVRARRPQWHVVLAYLELMTPDLPHAAAALVQAGCRRIRIVPMFLGSGGHVRRDLPALVQQLRDRHAGIEWSLHAAIGEHPDVIEAMAQAALADTD
jgi:sirohydrochlorin cobaltochelatase